MNDGLLHDEDYSRRSHFYVWATLRDVFPRGITPTDMDALVEVGGCFFVFEGKTDGTEVQVGQGRALREAILAWPVARSVVVLGTHAKLGEVDIGRDLMSLRFAWREDRGRPTLVWSPSLPGEALTRLCRYFVEEADREHRIHPSSWAARAEEESPWGDYSTDPF